MRTLTHMARKAVTARHLTHQTTDIMEGIFDKLLPSAAKPKQPKPLRYGQADRGISTKGSKRK